MNKKKNSISERDFEGFVSKKREMLEEKEEKERVVIIAKWRKVGKGNRNINNVEKIIEKIITERMNW